MLLCFSVKYDTFFFKFPERQDAKIDEIGKQLAKETKKRKRVDEDFVCEPPILSAADALDPSNILNENVDSLLNEFCDLVDADLTKLDIGMTQSSNFLRSVEDRVKQATQQLDSQIIELEKSREEILKEFDNKLEALKFSKTQTVGPYLEMVETSKKVLEKQTTNCKLKAQKASAKIKDRVQRFLEDPINDQ